MKVSPSSLTRLWWHMAVLSALLVGVGRSDSTWASQVCKCLHCSWHSNVAAFVVCAAHLHILPVVMHCVVSLWPALLSSMGWQNAGWPHSWHAWLLCTMGLSCYKPVAASP